LFQADQKTPPAPGLDTVLGQNLAGVTEPDDYDMPESRLSVHLRTSVQHAQTQQTQQYITTHTVHRQSKLVLTATN